MARYTNESIVLAALRGRDAETANGNMSTETRRAFTYTGRMPRAWAALLGERNRAGHVSQTIYSYATPIAWLDDEFGWVIPAVTYSPTTSSKHHPHLYRLRGTTYYMPWDATPEDARRVLAGELEFLRDIKGRAVGTVPGPNYIPEV